MAGQAGQADGQQQLQQFPPPPSFYKLFDPEAAGDDARPPPPPPPAPIDGEYELYGELHTTLDGVAPLPGHIQKLYRPNGQGKLDFRSELLRLNKEVLYTFVELLHTVSNAPGLSPSTRTQYDTQMLGIGLLMWNMHQLLNEMRPHQARATLEHMLTEQIAERKASIESLRRQSEGIQKQITAAAEQMSQGAAGMDVDKPIQ